MTCINPNLYDGEKYAEFLIQRGANVNTTDKAGRTALLMACHWSDKMVAECLIKYGANLNASTHSYVLPKKYL